VRLSAAADPHERALAAWGTGAVNVEASRVNGYWPAHIALSHLGGCTEARCTSECPTALIDAAHPDLRPSRMFFCAKVALRAFLEEELSNLRLGAEHERTVQERRKRKLDE
jgi:hypothetical protein